MRHFVLPLILVISLPAFADQKEECLATLRDNAQTAEVKANERATYVRKIVALLTDAQKSDFSILRRNIEIMKARIDAAKALQTEESAQIDKSLADFRKGTPPAGLSVEQTAQALEQAKFEAKQAHETSRNKVAQAESDISSHAYRLKSYAYPIFKANGGGIRAKFQAVIEEAQENGFTVQIRSDDQTYVDYVTVQEGKDGFGRGPGSAYLLGSGEIHLFTSYFNSMDPIESAASYEQLGWTALSNLCKGELSKHRIYGQRDNKQTLPVK